MTCLILFRPVFDIRFSRISIGILILIAVFMMIQVGFSGSSQQERSQSADLTANFFLPEMFHAADRSSEGFIEPGQVVAVLVPHHLIAGTSLASMFKLLASKQPNKVFIIGPNHYGVGQADVLTSSVAKVSTPFGAQQLIRWIEYPEMSHELLEHEHSVMGLIPYLDYYLDAETQLFVLKANSSDGMLQTLAEGIGRELDEDSVAVFSVDFSHYLPKEIADRNDARTAQLLLAMDEKVIYTLNNDYVDSPPSLALMFKLCRMKGATIRIVDHSNSADMLGQPNVLSTTSHFTGYCAI